MPSKTFCVIDIEPFQPLFVVIGPKWKWCGTVSFPFEMLFCRVRLQNTGIG